MRRVYLTTLKRGVYLPDLGEDAGLLYCLDWDTGNVFKKIPIAAGTDPAAPGRSHGCRGVAVHEGKLYVAWYQNNLSVFDLDTLDKLYDLTFPEIQCTHQIKSHDGYLWVVSTGNNSFVKIKQDKIVDIVNLKEINDQVSPFFSGQHLHTRDWDTEDKLHFNSIGWSPEGDMFHAYYEVNMLFNWTKKSVLHQGSPLQHPHDILFLDSERFVTSNSALNRTVLFNLDGSFEEFNQQRGSGTDEEKAAWVGHTRGLAAYGNGKSLFACSAPGNVCLYDTDSLELEKSVTITDVDYETIYDIVLDPRDWSF